VSELRVTRDRGVARLTLSRPPLNVLSPALIDALGATFRELGADPALRVVVLEGAGRAFSAGVDVAAMCGLDTAGARALIGTLRTTVRALEEVPVPTLARLHGHVLGGALELVLACDLRVAAASCRLGMPEITVGIPSVIQAALLPGLIGWGRTRELLLWGENIDAETALAWGLVEQVVPPPELDAAIDARLDALLTAGPQAVRLQKKLIRDWENMTLDQSVRAGIESFKQAYAADEPTRMMATFVNRARQKKG
jgi:enoyl-CoA hydratase